jgi:hypothetical protein
MSNIQKLKSIWSLFVLSLVSVVSFAQETGGADIDVNINKGGEWYQQTWVWIVGGALFVLLLVAILRGGSRKAE